MLVRGVPDPQGTDKFPARSCHQASFMRRSFVCHSVFQLPCIGARSSHGLYSSPARFWSGGDFLHVFSPSPVHSDWCSAWASIRRPALFPSAFVRREEAYLAICPCQVKALVSAACVCHLFLLKDSFLLCNLIFLVRVLKPLN
jgi:hypothetical protein